MLVVSIIVIISISVSAFANNLTLAGQATNNTKSGEPRFFTDLSSFTFPYIPSIVISPSSTQRLQFIWGVGIPLSFSLESLVFGLVLKAAYFLPTYLRGPFSLQAVNFPGLSKRKRRMLSERYDGTLKVLEEVPISSSEEREHPKFKEEKIKSNKNQNQERERFTRWHAYTIMEAYAKG